MVKCQTTFPLPLRPPLLATSPDSHGFSYCWNMYEPFSLPRVFFFFSDGRISLRHSSNVPSFCSLHGSGPSFSSGPKTPAILDFPSPSENQFVEKRRHHYLYSWCLISCLAVSLAHRAWNSIDVPQSFCWMNEYNWQMIFCAGGFLLIKHASSWPNTCLQHRLVVYSMY